MSSVNSVFSEKLDIMYDVSKRNYCIEASHEVSITRRLPLGTPTNPVN